HTLTLPSPRSTLFPYTTLFRSKSYDPKKMSDNVKKLAADSYVTNRKGIFEYLLGGSVDKKLLAVRVFDDKVKNTTYAKQTQAARSEEHTSELQSRFDLVCRLLL